MSIFLKHILRNIKENVGRTAMILISLFGVGVIVSVALGVTFTLNSLIDSLSNAYAGGFQYIVSSSTEEEITYDRVKQTNEDFDYLGIPEYNYGYIYDNENSQYVSFPLVGLDLNQAEKLELIEIDEKGEINLNSNEIIVSQSMAKKYEWDKNDTIIYFDEKGNEHNFVIKYIANDSGILVDGAFTGVSIVVSESAYMQINNLDSLNYDFLCLNYLGNKKIDNLTEELYNIEDNYGLEFSVKPNANVMDVFGDYIKIGIVAIVLIIIIVFFTINSIVKIIMNERIPIIGTFRSIGATSKKMNALLISEMALYGLFGGVGGAFIGVTLTKAFFSLFEMVGETMNLNINMISFEKYSFYIILATVSFLILFQICLSISEIIKSNKISIKDCIFNKHESIYTYTSTKLIIGIFFLLIGLLSVIFIKKLIFSYCIIGIISLFISLSLLLPIITKLIISLFDKNKNPVVQMSTNTVVYNKLQISSNIIISVMLTISLISFSLLNYSVNNYKSKIDMVKSDIYASSSYENIKITSELAGIDGVDTVGSLYTSNLADNYDKLSFANNDVNNLYVIYSDDYKNLIDNSNVIDLNCELANNLKDNEVIVSNYYKKKYNLKIGDIVVLKGITESKRFTIETPYNLKVVGFADTSKINYMGIIMSKKIATEELQSFSSSKFFVKLTENADYKSVKNKVLKSLTYQMPEVFSQDEYVENIENNMKSSYKSIAVVILVIVGIALIGIINNQTVSFMERKKEIAILYSTSMSRKQLNNMLLKELLISYIFSSCTAFIFTILLIQLLKYTISMLGLYIPLSFSIFAIIVLLIILALIMSAIYLVMKRKIKKMNIVEEIKYE